MLEGSFVFRKSNCGTICPPFLGANWVGSLSDHCWGGGGVGKEENTLLATALLIAKYTWPCMHALA